MSEYEPLELHAFRGYEVSQVRIVLREDLLRSKTSVNITKGETIGHVAPVPANRGGIFGLDLKQSEELYRAGKYRDAAEVLRLIVVNGEEDPFVLNAYARALYRFDREASFVVYERLVTGQDRLVEELDIEPGVKPALVDNWFEEAYWKLGTLRLDRQEFRAAAFDICRALFAMGLYQRIPDRLEGDDERRLAEEQLQYLTEAHAELGEHESARYYARWTLRVNPANTYIYDYIARGSF